MPDKPDSWAWLSTLLETYWPAIYTAGLAGLIAAFRIIYEGGKLRQVLIEAPFLGLAALMFSHGVALLGINQDVAPFFGGMVGFIGVESTRELALRMLNKGVKKDDT
ncbi:holin [Thiopseudomonas alkaliphila]|nr:holin [Thiopseudomonas alkaliphila]